VAVVAVVVADSLVLDNPTIIIPELLVLRMVRMDKVEAVATELVAVVAGVVKMVVLVVDFLVATTAAILAKTGLV
jgi:hypothetical protein